jgi:hypothetical protein
MITDPTMATSSSSEAISKGSRYSENRTSATVSRIPLSGRESRFGRGKAESRGALAEKVPEPRCHAGEHAGKARSTIAR